MALVTQKSLFVHVPKTGGTTVRHALHLCKGPLWESGPIDKEKHIGLPELLVEHPGTDAGRFVFGFARHPVPWLRSRWAWAVDSGLAGQTRIRSSAVVHWIASCWSDDYHTFVERYLERYPGVCTQTHFRMLGLWSDRPVDFVGRVESLTDDLIEAFRRAGEVFDEGAVRALPRLNVSSAEDVKLPKGLESRIIDAERGMVDRFYV